jgi:TonB family protein
MKKVLFGALFQLCIVFITAQVSPTDPEFEGQLVGGKEQLDQVLQTQLTFPKSILTSTFDEEVTVFFDLDTAAFATNFKFSKGLNNIQRNELKRIFRFMKFKKTQSTQYEPMPYFLTLHLSTEKYSKYYKQKSKLNIKRNFPADSSYIIYTKADKSPEYFKNGDEGLAEFMLNEIEYPKIARERTIEGTVILEFVVETNGYVTGVEVKKGVNGGCTEEAIRLIKLTKWQPAVLNNKLVRYKTTYPITFSLRNTSRDGTSAPGN